MEIKITCKGQKYLPIESLVDFQGELKALSGDDMEKLKKSIVEIGFSFPVYVWKNYILDGHQRLLAVRDLLDDGHSIDNIPVVEIDADDETHAAKKLLILNSKYGKISEDGIIGFTDKYDIDLTGLKDILCYDDLDIDDIINEFDIDLSENPSENHAPNDSEKLRSCPKCGFEYKDR